MKRWLGALTVLLWVLIAGIAPAKDIRAPRFADTLALNLHRPGDRGEGLDLIRDTGFRTIRIDATWAAIETRKGVYDFTWLDRATQALSQRGFRVILILAYSNPLYEDTVPDPDGRGAPRAAAPRSPESIAAYVRFARAVAMRYKRLDPILEIWNEPDLGFWAPQPDVNAYLTLATATCRGIRGTDKSATIIAPGVAQTPHWPDLTAPFLEAVLRSDLTACLDGISVHPYLHIGQLDWTPTLWQTLTRMRDSHWRGQGRPPVLISSESGLSTYREGITDETQAAYVVRMFLLNAASGVPLSVLYTWDDSGPDPKNPQRRYGILLRDGTPKPAFFAVKHMSQVLGASRFTCRTDWPEAIGLTFDGMRGGPVLTVWPRSGPSEWRATVDDRVRLPVSADKSYRAVDLLGRAVPVTVENGHLTVGPGLPPFYLHGRGQTACATPPPRPAG